MMAHLLIWLIKMYQILLSPFFGQQCRFSPTCSQYALDAINKHGALRGAYYAIRRLLRWHPGGHDPAP